MESEKQSFLSNILGKDTYDEFKSYAKLLVAIGTCVLIFVYLLSLFLHLEFISSLLNIVSGTSLLFVAYLAALILVLDIEIDVNDPEEDKWDYRSGRTKPIAYYFTIVWGVVLVLLAITAIYYSNEYRKHYAFECETFLVDTQAGVYHLNYNNGCEIAADSNNLVSMKGYEFEDYGYTLCEWCDEWATDEEDYFETDQYVRRK